MEINPKLLAPCGLYCGVCSILYATKENNQKFRERLLGVYKANFPIVRTLPWKTFGARVAFLNSLFSTAKRAL